MDLDYLIEEFYPEEKKAIKGKLKQVEKVIKDMDETNVVDKVDEVMYMFKELKSLVKGSRHAAHDVAGIIGALNNWSQMRLYIDDWEDYIINNTSVIKEGIEKAIESINNILNPKTKKKKETLHLDNGKFIAYKRLGD